MDDAPQTGRCALCGRERPLTFHHLIPRTVHSNKWFKQRFSRDEMQRGIDICRPCHSYIHKHFTHKELARELNTLDALLDNPTLRRYIDWARRRS